MERDVYGIEETWYKRGKYEGQAIGRVVYKSKEKAYEVCLNEAIRTYEVGGLILEEHPEWYLVDVYEPNGRIYATLKVIDFIYIE